MKYTITADISANQKKLRKLEFLGIIEIYQIDIETPSPKTRKVMPTGVFNHVNLDNFVLGSEEESQNFEIIKQVIGKHNIKDAMHLSDHIRDKRDFFVTEDTDILSKRSELYKKFPALKIQTTDELVREL